MLKEMTTAEHCGLLMLLEVGNRELVNRHVLTDRDLSRHVRDMKRNVMSSANYINQLRQTLVAAEKELAWHKDQLEWAEGVVYVRHLIRSEENARITKAADRGRI
jgi:hypothetical protein